ncbi:MAG: CAP domain-containing protein [Hyphomicrobiaceae bacterium]|nr:CAP domain-containing protein [Hyphomicrobiaceae bacterium]
MYRVALCAGLTAMLAACSLGSSTLTSGFAESSPPPTTASLRKSQGAALGGEPGTPRNIQLAKLDDKAPPGTFERAEPGILSDRDYSRTRLNAEMARDVINAYRKEHGLKPLKLNPELTEAAKGHSRDLAKWDRISHYGSDGSNPWDRVKRTGYKARLAAENVGTGQIDFNEVMKGWKESPGHNKNLLLPDAEQMGIALVQDPKTEFKSFWTLVLGSPM